MDGDVQPHKEHAHCCKVEVLNENIKECVVHDHLTEGPDPKVIIIVFGDVLSNGLEPIDHVVVLVTGLI